MNDEEKDDFMRWAMSMPQWEHMTAEQLIKLWTETIGSKAVADAYRRGVEDATQAKERDG